MRGNFRDGLLACYARSLCAHSAQLTNSVSLVMAIARYLELHSECVIGQLECELIEHPEYFVFRTPTKPTYHYGNLLSLKCPLDSYSHVQWMQHFRQAFADLPLVEHATFCWPRSQEVSSVKDDFLAAGFSYEEVHVLSLERNQFSPPTVLNQTVTLKALTSASHWQQWLELALAEQQGDYNSDGLRDHLQGRHQNYAALAAIKAGEYLGAFIGEQLVGYAGLYHQHHIARFQNVHVIPAFQQQQIAKTLLTALIQRAPRRVDTFVIVADENYHATKLYQSLGFNITERNCSVSWWPASQRK